MFTLYFLLPISIIMIDLVGFFYVQGASPLLFKHFCCFMVKVYTHSRESSKPQEIGPLVLYTKIICQSTDHPKRTQNPAAADMGKPKHSSWEHVKSILDPANPNKRRWQCNYCNKDYAGGALRIKVHLGLERDQGIEVCQKVKEGQMSQVPKNGTSSATENTEATGFSCSGLIFNQDSESAIVYGE
ncbi:uncharacterized protein LOC116201028 [Punica granatum]|uniref:Uncharacterized protein LOC116201028 n=1 Tax=Punica granatum TaxID=22663 RepID=A0A6P8D9T6_PUNGR|nr:uncharacterized protein LOC116201028 [Punica granatum]